MCSNSKKLLIEGSEVQIIDDFLDNYDFEYTFSNFFNTDIPWTFSETLPYEDCKEDKLEKLCSDEDNFQFVHIFFSNHQYKSSFDITRLISKLNPAGLIRIKANLNLKTEKIIRHGFHTDTRAPNSKTAVYYLNDCDGFTEFKDGTRIESKKNRICIFDSHLAHTGTTCTNQQRRIVVNVNYFPF